MDMDMDMDLVTFNLQKHAHAIKKERYDRHLILFCTVFMASVLLILLRP